MKKVWINYLPSTFLSDYLQQQSHITSYIPLIPNIIQGPAPQQWATKHSHIYSGRCLDFKAIYGWIPPVFIAERIHDECYYPVWDEILSPFLDQNLHLMSRMEELLFCFHSCSSDETQTVKQPKNQNLVICISPWICDSILLGFHEVNWGWQNSTSVLSMTFTMIK